LLIATAFALAAWPSARAAEPGALEKKARDFVAALEKEDYATAVKGFDETMTKVMPEEKLKETWQSLVKQVGPLKNQGAATLEKAGKYDAVIVTCEFEKAPLAARVVYDAEGRVSGLQFRPAFTYKAPDYVQRDAFKEAEVQVGAGEWAVPGTLAVPVGDGPFPAVVLVHGSGPHDRDETIGPNKTFRDLAWGLASRGVAVLRYEKRTKHHAKKLADVKDFTVREEVLDDARAAVSVLRKTKGIDPKKVFVVGHSLGAMAAPRLAEADGELAGIVLLAGPSRPLEVLTAEQVDYILSVKPDISKEEKEVLERLKAAAEKLKDPKLSPDTPASELLGLSLGYWQSMRDLQPPKVAAGLTRPILVLQGERDYQVTMVDFRGWEKALEGRKNVELKSYPKLNHLFVEGEGKSKPAEYAKEGHVAKEVVEDVAGWVKRQ
jgi:dienelactone hydrolase